MTSEKENSRASEARTRRSIFLENPSVLAFLGDSVYELFVRRYVYERGVLRPDRMNRETVRYVRAEAQAVVYDALLPNLTEEERSVARRAKNHRITSMPGHLDPNIYKKATAFEALLGFLELCGDTLRRDEILTQAVEITESSDFALRRSHTNPGRNT